MEGLRFDKGDYTIAIQWYVRVEGGVFNDYAIEPVAPTIQNSAKLLAAGFDVQQVAGMPATREPASRRQVRQSARAQESGMRLDQTRVRAEEAERTRIYRLNDSDLAAALANSAW